MPGGRRSGLIWGSRQGPPIVLSSRRFAGRRRGAGQNCV